MKQLRPLNDATNIKKKQKKNTCLLMGIETLYDAKQVKLNIKI